MDYYFFDSNAIVKNYIVETAPNWVKSIFNSAATSVIYAVSIAEVEVISAFARRLEGKTLTINEAMIASTQFRYDFANDLRVVAVEPILLNRAVMLAENMLCAVMMPCNFPPPSKPLLTLTRSNKVLLFSFPPIIT